MDGIERQFDLLPPHSLEAEACLLGAMMLAGNEKAIFAQSRAIVSKESFYLAEHGVLFEVLCKMHDEGIAVDAVTTMDALKALKLWEEVGGREFIGGILMKVPSSAHFAHYARDVQGTAMLRDGIAISNDFLRNAYQRGRMSYKQAAEEFLNTLATKANRIAQGAKAIEVYKLGDVAREVANRHTQQDLVDAVWIKTGIESLDQTIGGLRRGGKTIIGGKPGMGKSALLKQLLKNISADGIPVGLITIEESRQKVAENALSAESGVRNNRIAFSTASQQEWEEIDAAVSRLGELPYFICDSARKLSKIVAMASVLVCQFKCQVIAVDHLHIVDGESEENREREISKISAALKWAWKDLSVAGIEAAQLNRAGGRDRPTLVSLRDSGSLEQDGDVILLLHREDYYRRTEGGEMDEILEIIIAKNKDGAAGVRPVKFDESLQSIRDFEAQVPEGVMDAFR